MNWLSMKAAWKQGVEARRAGEPLDANPYPLSAAQFESWSDGWHMDDVAAKTGKPKK